MSSAQANSRKRNYSAVFLISFLLSIFISSAVVDGLRTRTPALAWQPLTTTTSTQPPVRTKGCMSFDGTKRILLFGGTGDGLLNDLWEFDFMLKKWTMLHNGTGYSPAPRFSFTCGYDTTRRQLVITLGQGDGRFFADTWGWSDVSKTWVMLDDGKNGGPPERYGISGGIWTLNSTFGSNFLITTHGFNGKGRFRDTHAFDLRTNKWQEVDISGERPTARCLLSASVYSTAEAGDKSFSLQMFGGCGFGGWGPCPNWDNHKLSLYELEDGSLTGAWMSLSACPKRRVYSSMFHLPNGDVLLYGGVGFSLWGATEAVSIFEFKPTLKQTLVTGVPTSSESEWNSQMPYGNVVGEREGPQMTSVWQATRGAAGADLPSSVARSRSKDLFGNVSMIAEVWGVMFGAPDTMLYAIGPVIDTSMTFNDVPCESTWDLRIIHGSLMFAAWGFFLPIGGLIARFARSLTLGEGRTPLWLMLHRTFQVSGLLLAIAGVIVANRMIPSGHLSARPHAILGIVTMVLGLLQPISIFFEPNFMVYNLRRKLWLYWHWWGGRSALVIGAVTIYYGLYMIQASHAIIGLVIGWLVCLFVFYVFGQIYLFKTTTASDPFLKVFSPWQHTPHKKNDDAIDQASDIPMHS